MSSASPRQAWKPAIAVVLLIGAGLAFGTPSEFYGTPAFGDMVFTRWAWLAACAATLALWPIFKKSLPLGLMIAWATLSGIRGVFSWDRVTGAAAETAQESGIALIAIISLIIIASQYAGVRRAIMNTTLLVLWIPALWICGSWALGHDVQYRIPIFGNPSIAASTPILVLPAILSRIDKKNRGIIFAAVIPVAVSAFLARAVSPWIILEAQMIALAIAHKRYITLLIVVGSIAYVASTVSFESIGNGRAQEWIDVLGWIHREPVSTWLFGTGLGTAFYQLDLAHRALGHSGASPWVWIHNDWLQIYLELGAVGLGLAAALFCSATVSAKNRPMLLASVFGMAAFMMTAFPLHLAVPSVFAAMTVSQIYRGEA